MFFNPKNSTIIRIVNYTVLNESKPCINPEQLSDIKYAVHSPRFNHSKDKLVSCFWFWYFFLAHIAFATILFLVCSEMFLFLVQVIFLSPVHLHFGSFISLVCPSRWVGIFLRLRSQRTREKIVGDKGKRVEVGRIGCREWKRKGREAGEKRAGGEGNRRDMGEKKGGKWGRGEGGKREF